MIALKCPMCGGTLDAPEGKSTINCKFCDTNIELANSNSKNTDTTTAHGVKAKLRNGFIYLEQQEFKRAAASFDDAIKQQADCAEAYFGLYLCNYTCANQETAAKHVLNTLAINNTQPQQLTAEIEAAANHQLLQKALRYADDALKARLLALQEELLGNREAAAYALADKLEKSAASQMITARINTYMEVEKLFLALKEYRDAPARAKNVQQAKNYEIACQTWRDTEKLEIETQVVRLREAASIFEALGQYRDAQKLAKTLYEKADMLAQEVQNQIKRKKRNKLIGALGITAVCIAAAIAFILYDPMASYRPLEDMRSSFLTAGRGNDVAYVSVSSEVSRDDNSYSRSATFKAQGNSKYNYINIRYYADSDYFTCLSSYPPEDEKLMVDAMAAMLYYADDGQQPMNYYQNMAQQYWDGYEHESEVDIEYLYIGEYQAYLKYYMGYNGKTNVFFYLEHAQP